MYHVLLLCPYAFHYTPIILFTHEGIDLTENFKIETLLTSDVEAPDDSKAARHCKALQGFPQVVLSCALCRLLPGLAMAYQQMSFAFRSMDALRCTAMHLCHVVASRATSKSPAVVSLFNQTCVWSTLRNGILVTRSARWPLCVDPQMQIVTWLKKKEEKARTIAWFAAEMARPSGQAQKPLGEPSKRTGFLVQGWFDRKDLQR